MINKLIKIILIFSISLNTACEGLSPQLTKKLWKNKTESEQIKNILISEDGKSLAMIGDRFHYIFKNESGLIKRIFDKKEVLKPEVINNPRYTKPTFLLKDNGEVETFITIRVENNEEARFQGLKEKYGFKEIVIDVSTKKRVKLLNYLEGSIKLEGEFYQPDRKVNYDSLPSKLSRKYDVLLKYEHGLMKKMYSVPLTPITVVTDAVSPFVVIAVAVGLIVYVVLPVTIIYSVVKRK